MGLFDLFSRRSAAAPVRSIEDIAADLDGAGRNASVAGISISTQMALQIATAVACVRVISDGCATPELHVFREKSDGAREMATNIPEYRMLNRRPNEWQTSFEFRRLMTTYAAFTGDAVAFKVMSGNRCRELIPVRPDRVLIHNFARYQVAYSIYDEFGHIGDFGPDDVLHLKNMQWDLLQGFSVMKIAAQALGLSRALEISQGALHENGGRPAGILTTDKSLSQEAAEKLKASFSRFTRSERSGTAILDNGLKFESIAVNAVDSQHLETRRFQVEEICRAFGVFPIMIGHSDKTATFASAEAFFAAHRIQTMTPWWQMWRQRLDEFVLDGAGPLFADFDTRYLQAGSMVNRAQWARTMAELGIYTRNELRDEEGKDPLPGLDEPLTPLNMANSSDAKDKTDVQNDPQV